MGNLIEKGKEWAQKIPEFSSQTYVIVAYVISALVTVAALFLVYEAVTTDALFFGANWNMPSATKMLECIIPPSPSMTVLL